MPFSSLRTLLPFRSRTSRGCRGRTRQLSGRGTALALEALEDRYLLAVFTVTTTGDAGPGSLRQALLDANANPGLNTIAFNIGDGGVQTIRPNSPLPTIERSVILDGTTQPGFAGRPLIVLNGSNLRSATGLTFFASGSTVRGLVIQGFSSAGIFLYFGSSNNTITGNYLGTDVSGTQAVGNGAGLALFMSANDRIGGTEPGTGNLISGNGVGISITSESGPEPEPSPAASIFIQGNSIGTDVTGTRAVPNGIGISIIPGGRAGVAKTLIGGAEAGAGNVISGNNDSGIVIRGGGHVVQGNYIGTDSSGTRSLGNHTYGVDISGATSDLVGGTTVGARNLISGNGIAGVHIAGTALVEGNWIGTDSTGSVGLGNGSGIRVEGAGNTVGGTEAGAGNLISGNFSAGVFLAGSDNRVQGNAIGTDAAGTGRVSNGYGVYIVSGSGNLVGGVESGAGNVISGNVAGVVIFSSRGNAVQGNRIGTDASGVHALSNGDGVALNGPDNLVGGTAVGAGNLISGNLQSGVSIASSGNTVQGNTIGTDIAGTGRLGNENGVYIGVGANNNTVGGEEVGAGNLISSNRNAGVLIFGQGNVVRGNSIGTDISGTRALANHTGVRIDGGSDNQIGGTSAAARNLISGSLAPSVLEGEGILISQGSRNVVEGNYIGTDSTGSQALGNRNGIRIVEGRDNRIGGTQPGAGNLISGNRPSGPFDGKGIVVSQSSGTLIQGNFIGPDASGSRILGNGQGIQIDRSSENTIGGTAPGAGNVISGNSNFEGVFITGSNNRVQGNYIGTDAAGARALGNVDGVVIDSAGSLPSVNNVIGGTEPGAGNLISGNTQFGVYINAHSVSNNRVQGNYIGTDATGSRALGNLTGCFLLGAENTLIGGTVPGAGNVISGNRDSGLTLSGTTIVQGNYVGTDATGTLAVPNRRGVVFIGSASLLGGTESGARNVISGNTIAGVDIGDGMFYAGHGIQVQGNYIGTDLTGTRAVPNGTGVRIIYGEVSESSDNTIGGATPGAGNLISGNRRDGVLINLGNRNVVEGNLIGTDVTGTLPLGNGGNGVTIDFMVAPANNRIGGTAGGAGNTIAFNGQDGILVTRESIGNAIRQNAIFSNGGLGIELLSGGNRMQAAPVLTSATGSGGITTIQGTLTSTANTTFTIELFANRECDPSGFGEGERFLASLTVATSAAGRASFLLILALPVDLGQFITATTTDPGGNTSQFSNCVEVSMANPPGASAGGRGGIPMQGVSSMAARAAMAPVHAPLESQAALDLFFAAIGMQRPQPGSVHDCRHSNSPSSFPLDLPSLTPCDSIRTMESVLQANSAFVGV